MSEFTPLYGPGKPRVTVSDGPTPFVLEAKRLFAARLASTSPAEQEDAEWALTYLFQMQRTGRIDEYMALRAEQITREAQETR